MHRLARRMSFLAVVVSAGCGFRTGLEVSTGDAWVVESIVIHESHGDLIQGEHDVPMTITLVNRASVAEPTPVLHPSVTIAENDVSGDYTISTVSATPDTKTVAAGGTLVVNASLSVGPDATLGEAGFGVSIDGVESDVTATMPVRKRATIELASGATPQIAGTTCIGVSTTASYTVEVTNTGASGAVFTDPGLELSTTLSDVSDAFTVSGDALPATLAPGASASFTFHIQALATAGNALGNASDVSVVLDPGGTDARTAGPARYLSDPFERAMTVHHPALLEIEVLAPTPTTVTAGQTGIALSYKLTNAGGTGTTVTATSPALFSGTTTATGDYTLTPNPAPTLPVTLAPAASLTLTYSADVSASPAFAGPITLRPTNAGTDEVCGTSVLTGDAVALWTL